MSRSAKRGTGPFALKVTLRDGTEHSFTVATMPRHYASWVMHKLPCDTDFFGARFSRSRVTSEAAKEKKQEARTQGRSPR